MSSEGTVHPSYAALSPEDRLAESADHEAGHYIIAHVCKFSIDLHYITIDQGRFAQDYARISGGAVSFFSHQQLSKDQLGMYAVAGMAAQLIGICHRTGNIHAAQDEDAQFRAGLGAENDVDQYLETYGKDDDWRVHLKPAISILLESWPLVAGLSKELQEHRTLYYKEAYLVVKALEGDDFCSEYLEVYRANRREVDISGPEYQVLRSKQPGMKWFESPEEFTHREGCSDLEQWPEWFEGKMGYPSRIVDDGEDSEEDDEAADDEAEGEDQIDQADDPQKTLLSPSLPAGQRSKLIAKSIFDELKNRVKNRLKDQVKRFAPWLDLD